MRKTILFLSLTWVSLAFMGCDGPKRPDTTTEDDRNKSQVEKPRPTLGQVAPEIEGEDIQGQDFKLSDYRGKVVVLDFWHHDCPPCRAMYPHHREMVERLKDKPFALLGVYTFAERFMPKRLAQDGQVTWRFWVDGKKSIRPILETWEIEYTPTMYILDQQGIIRMKDRAGLIHYKGLRGKEAVDAAVDDLLREGID